MKERRGDFQKEEKKSLNRSFLDNGGGGIIFSGRFEMLRGLKPKWMWDGIFCTDPEDRRINRTQPNPQSLEQGKGHRLPPQDDSGGRQVGDCHVPSLALRAEPRQMLCCQDPGQACAT